MPVVKAEPPVMAGEVAGSVSERALLEALFNGSAHLTDSVDKPMEPSLPLVGAGEPVTAARHELEKHDAIMVVEAGKPVGVLTRADLLIALVD
jgi:cystathionine beta-synthase